MKRRILALCCGLAMALTLTACGGTQEDTSSTGESQAVETSSQVESSQPQLKLDPSDRGDSPRSPNRRKALLRGPRRSWPWSRRSRERKPDTSRESPCLKTALSSFSLYYDGTSTVSGTYVENGGAYVLTPTGDTAQGTGASGAGEMELTPSGEGECVFRGTTGPDL